MKSKQIAGIIIYTLQLLPPTEDKLKLSVCQWRIKMSSVEWFPVSHQKGVGHNVLIDLQKQACKNNNTSELWSSLFWDVM